MFDLNATMIRKFYTLGNRFVYYIDGLRPTDNPCIGQSRWQRTLGACPSESSFADTGTKALILAALNNSTDIHNPFIRDINLETYRTNNGGVRGKLTPLLKQSPELRELRWVPIWTTDV